MNDYIQSLIEKMSLEEKASLCVGTSAWTTSSVDRLNIPNLIVSDGPHGVRRVSDIHSMDDNSLPATCFPTASCLASTWNTELIEQMGVALAEECIALNVDVLLGPGINMKRSPLGGRNFEYFSEDPYLSGELAVKFINGVQSKGVGVSLKHYAVNNQEFQRFSISAEVDERTLHEIYLPAFEMSVKQAQPWTVMCSYNKVNGTFASEHYQLLSKILKKEWGFEGLVVSDWGAVRDRVAALKAGLDLEMPGPQEKRVQAIVDAVCSGELDEAILNDSVFRILRIVLKSKKTTKTGTFDIEAHNKLAQMIASEGIVLLKNDNLLPLKGNSRIAIIGRSAEIPHFQGGGSSHINATKVSIPFKEIQSRSEEIELTYAEGYPNDDSFQQDLIDQAVVIAKEAEIALLFIALPRFKESEGYDREDLDLTKQQISLIKSVANVQPKTIVVLNNGSPVVMGDWIHLVPAVLEGWMMGQAGGAAIADILFGVTNPSGKIGETFPLSLSSTPSFTNFPGGAGKVYYGEGIFIGYRYYDTRQIPVLFPFGHGLSYTTFEYRNARVPVSKFKDSEGITITIDVQNTGELAGKEIVQVYVRDHQSGLIRPEKELKGFKKIELQPGETKPVSFYLDFRSFAYYHPKYRQWITESGDFDLLIGASSADIRSCLTVTLESTINLPCILDKESTLREWMMDPKGQEILSPIYSQIVAEAHRKSNGNGSDQNVSEGGLGMDMMDMFNDMPLVSVLFFQKDSWDTYPEELVLELLKQVHNA